MRTPSQEASSMDHALEGPELYEHDGWEHVTFGPVSVELVGVEEVAA